MLRYQVLPFFCTTHFLFAPHPFFVVVIFARWDIGRSCPFAAAVSLLIFDSATDDVPAEYYAPEEDSVFAEPPPALEAVQPQTLSAKAQQGATGKPRPSTRKAQQKTADKPRPLAPKVAPPKLATASKTAKKVTVERSVRRSPRPAVPLPASAANSEPDSPRQAASGRAKTPRRSSAPTSALAAPMVHAPHSRRPADTVYRSTVHADTTYVGSPADRHAPDVMYRSMPRPCDVVYAKQVYYNEFQ